MYDKVDERTAVAKWNFTLGDTKWVDTDKAFEGGPMKIRSRTGARELRKVVTGQNCLQELTRYKL